MRLMCKCGKGAASKYDKVCSFCREKSYSRAEAKSVGVKHRGDGLTLVQAEKLKHKAFFSAKGWL